MAASVGRVAHVAEADLGVGRFRLRVVEPVEVAVDEHLEDGEEGQNAEEFDQALLQDEVVLDASAVIEEWAVLLLLLLALDQLRFKARELLVKLVVVVVIVVVVHAVQVFVTRVLFLIDKVNLVDFLGEIEINRSKIRRFALFRSNVAHQLLQVPILIPAIFRRLLQLLERVGTTEIKILDSSSANLLAFATSAAQPADLAEWLEEAQDVVDRSVLERMLEFQSNESFLDLLLCYPLQVLRFKDFGRHVDLLTLFQVAIKLLSLGHLVR